VSTSKSEERRAHPRLSASLNAQSCPEQGGVVARMVTENLSMGGLYCTSDADFPEMTRLAVRLVLPIKKSKNGDTHSVDVEAVVVRREVLPSNSGNSRYKLGLFFTNVDDEARRCLTQFLD
jgi:c-di-GMP-binding flagellar brake protein YcgR